VSSLTGQRRDGRICVAAFMPPEAHASYQTWKQANIARYGPPDDWQIDIGRAVGGGDLVAVWVPEQHAPTAPS
jgi:hypothetical protein